MVPTNILLCSNNWAFYLKCATRDVTITCRAGRALHGHGRSLGGVHLLRTALRSLTASEGPVT